MASKSVNITISTPLGDLQIYTDPKEQARAERLIDETPSIMIELLRNSAINFSDL